MSSHLKGAYGLKGGVRADYSSLVFFSSQYKTSTYDLNAKQFVKGNKIDWYMAAVGVEPSCALGTNKYSITCVEPSSLVVQGDTLNLTLTGSVVWSSFTAQAWFNLQTYVSIPITGTPITLMSIKNLFALEYKDETLTLAYYNTQGTKFTTSQPISSSSILVKKWSHLAVTLRNFKWSVYLNKALLISTSTVVQGNYTSVKIYECLIINSNIQNVLKVKEFSFLGHALDLQEL